MVVQKIFDSGEAMLTNRIKKTFAKIFTAILFCKATSLSAHPRIMPEAGNDASYAISFQQDDLPEPTFASTSINDPIELPGIIRGLTVASTDGHFGKFDDLLLEDADYAIVIMQEHGILLLVASLEDGNHAVWTTWQQAEENLLNTPDNNNIE